MIDHSITESALIDKCLAGDQQALRALYDIHGARVYCLALRLTGSAADAEDIVQDAFLRAFGALGRFRRESKFSTWLYRIVLNRCRDLLATRNRRETVTDEQWEPDAEAAPEGPDSAEKTGFSLLFHGCPRACARCSSCTMYWAWNTGKSRSL